MIRRNLVNNLCKKRVVTLMNGDSITVPSYHSAYIQMNSSLASGNGEITLDTVNISVAMAGWVNLYFADTICLGNSFIDVTNQVINYNVTKRKITSKSDYVLVLIL